jgi:hypothetical protein
MNIEHRIQNRECRTQRGSAIILAIVLTSLLAIIGVLFLISSRVDSIATSSIADNKDLTLAVDTVIAKISEDLAEDVNKSIDPTDYPDASNFWLASIDPNDANMWPHITDLYNQLGVYAYLPVDKVLYEHGDMAGNSMPGNLYRADADGDGAPDSMWVQVPAKSSSKGKPIFAAVRIIDNGAMLNVNTGFKFEPSSSVGSKQADINLMALAGKPGSPPDALSESNLSLARNPSGSNYEKNVIWQYSDPCYPPCTPFDISDELEMRYRFLIDQDSIHTRLESNLWSKEFTQHSGFLVSTQPYDSSSDHGKSDWIDATDYNFVQPKLSYSYRHIATIYNCDRIITPAGDKMVNINTAEPTAIRDTIWHGLVDANAPGDVSGLAAQIAANLIDYTDGTDPNNPRYDPNNDVTVVYDDTGFPHFGFETPCIYISELAQNFYLPDPNNPSLIYRSYAIELFKPYWQDDEPNGWQILTTDSNGVQHITPVIWTGSRRFHVLANIDPQAGIPINLNNDVPGPNEANLFDPAKFDHLSQPAVIDFAGGSTIYLQRIVNGLPLTIDVAYVPGNNLNGSGWLEPNTTALEVHSFERDIKAIHRCIRQVWNPEMLHSPTIGWMNPYDSGTEMIQAHPANKSFTNIGELGQIFDRNAYGYQYGGIDVNLPLVGVTEPNLRIDLTLPAYQQIFKYLTVWPPSFVDANETRIKGRININTAPWFVIAQLPWVSAHTPNYELARTIVAYRDKTIVPGGIDYSTRPAPYGFRSIGELMRVTNLANDPCSIGYYASQPFASIPSVLMTPNNTIDFPNEDVFEKRDLIFDRISNLVTVRSDVFTAYILVRIGQNGPQKRVIAILDRTGVVPDPTSPSGYAGKVKVIAIQNVPDPR